MELHVKYAPILRFNKAESFFPMRVDALLSYSSLHEKGQTHPLLRRGEVTPDELVRRGRSGTTFLRSVEKGPFTGQEVVANWGKGALEMVYRYATTNPAALTETLARKAYSWFGPKTARAVHLFWWNDLVRHTLEESIISANAGELPRLVLPDETHQSAVEQYAQHAPDYAYYHRQTKDGGFLCLQYWFFYSYNDWGFQFAGMNDHEGDWEGMMLFFRLDDAGRPQEPPAFVTFADHESCQTKPWGHDDLTIIGSHPVGFVGAGSHATYLERKTHPLMKLYNLYDYATGDGVTIDHDDWVHRIELEEVNWLGAYRGSWGTRFWLPARQANDLLKILLGAAPFIGVRRLTMPDEFELPGVSAPHGPVGAHRPQYAAPAIWAGIPEK